MPNVLDTNPYDAMGNVVTDAVLGAMKYDQAGRLRETQVAGKTITYDYDAESRRVKRHYAGLGTTHFVYDGSGQLAAEYGASEAMLCQRCYLSADALGSTRLMTDDAGTVKQRTDYLPFGDVITASQTQGGGRQAVLDGGQMMYTLAGGATQKFTGKERDAETGLDYFGARYLASGRGRFVTADLPFADQKTQDPQSWNLYVYAANNPLRYLDPDGRQIQPVIQLVLNEVAKRSAPMQRFAEYLERNAAKGAAIAAEIATGVTTGSKVADFNANRLISEHPGLSRDNALAVVEAPFGTSVQVEGANNEGPDVKLYENPDGVGPPNLLLQTEVKVSGINNLSKNISDAATQLGERGGVAFLQVPNGSAAKVKRVLGGFLKAPGRDPQKYKNVLLDIREENGTVIHSGGVN